MGKTEQVGTEACNQIVGSEVDIANHKCKQVVGSEVDIAKHGKQVVGTEVDIEKHAVTEDDKIVVSADCMTHVGRKDRWSRVANGKGKGITSKKMDRDSSSGRHLQEKGVESFDLQGP